MVNQNKNQGLGHSKNNKISTQGITNTVSGSGDKKRLTVDDLDPNEPIFVYNNSRGDHTISVRTGDGGVIPITVPKTFIPVQITEQVAPEVLIRSEDFRRACFKNVLILVPKKDAVPKLESKNAILEIERLRKQSNFSGIDYLKDPGDNTSIIEAAKNTNPTVSIVIKDILMREDLSEDDKISLLANEERLGSMDRPDFEYVISTTEQASKLSKWATNKLNKHGSQILK